jgi:hypothetical protein
MVVGLALLSILASGYAFYSENHAIQIPLVESLSNPSLFEGDPFVDTLDAYPSLLWRFLALVGAQGAWLQGLLFVGFVAERLLLVYACGRLSRALWPGSRLALYSACALPVLQLRGLLALGVLEPRYLEQTGLSIPFFLLALAAVVEGRPWLWAVSMAVGVLFNPMYGLYAATYLLPLAIGVLRDREQRRSWLGAALLAAVLASPVALQAIGSGSRPAADEAVWLETALLRFSHHLAPASWPPSSYVQALALAGLAFVVAISARACWPRVLAMLTGWTAVAAAWLALAFASAYLLRVPLLLVLHPGRGTDLWCALAAVVALGGSAALIELGEDVSRRWLARGLWVASLCFWLPGSGMGVPAMALGGLVLAGGAVMSRAPGGASAASGSAAPVLVVALAAALLVVVAERARVRVVETADPREVFVHPPPAALLDLARWSRSSTPEGSTFLVDPDLSRFRALARRPVYATVKDGSAIFWDRSFVAVWLPRMQELGYRGSAGLPAMKRETKAFYESLDDEAVSALADREDLDYWVVAADRPSALEPAYTSAEFKVLRLR